MKAINKFEQFDEVVITGEHKHGIVVDYAHIKEFNTYNYLVDCENEILTYAEHELKKV